MADRPPGHRAGWCVHYRYTDDETPGRAPCETCRAGVNYVDLNGGTKVGWMARLPCFIKKDEAFGQRVHCDSFRAPTADEVAAREAWSTAMIDKLQTVLKGIVPWRVEHHGKNVAETVECPACAGRLHLSIAASNGQVHGRCETPGCVDWME